MTTVHTGSGATLTLVHPPRREGGEGCIHECREHPGLLVKLFKPKAAGPEKFRKIARMVEDAPGGLTANGHPLCAWPLDTVAGAPNGPVAGFVMPRVDGPDIKPLWSCLIRGEHSMTQRHLHAIAINYAWTCEKLHARGCVVGDIHPNNVLIDHGTGDITVIDCDSFQIPNPQGGVFGCEVLGLPGYYPPELMGGGASAGTRSPQTDSFGLGAVVFHLLVGQAPFGADANKTAEERVAAGEWLYCGRGQGPAPGATPWAELDPAMRDLFVRLFDDGHGDPAARPSATEIRKALQTSKGNLVECGNGHWHVAKRPQCCWCEREGRRKRALAGRRFRRMTAQGGNILRAPLIGPRPVPILHLSAPSAVFRFLSTVGALCLKHRLLLAQFAAIAAIAYLVLVVLATVLGVNGV